ncbi:MAG: hypothetical protein ACRCSG_06060 [Cellulosilyticaceae bacterium]
MIFNNLQAIIPYYTDCGENFTKLIDLSGNVTIDKRKITTFIRALHFETHIDPRARKHWSSQLVGSKLTPPLLFDENVIFLPIKMRRNVGKNDAAYGYFLLNSITELDNYSITLKGNITINTFSSKDYLLNKRREALLLLLAYNEYKKGNNIIMNSMM